MSASRVDHKWISAVFDLRGALQLTDLRANCIAGERTSAQTVLSKIELQCCKLSAR